MEEFKNYYNTHNWNVDSYSWSTYEDYLACNNINGYVVTGFSRKALQMYEDGIIPSTLYIPSKYNDNSEYEDNNGHGELDVVAINQGIGNSGIIDIYSGNGNIFDIVKTLYIPSSVVALGGQSLTCVTAYDTKIQYSKNSKLKYMENYTYALDCSYADTFGEKYVKIPDSVEIFGVQGTNYWINYYLLGNNLKTLMSYYGTIYDWTSGDYPYSGHQNQPWKIAFFNGNMDELNNNEVFTSNDCFTQGTSPLEIMYCMKDNKMAIQEQNGDKFTWSEITDEELKNAIKDSINDADDSVVQDYIDSFNVIINKAKAKFN